MKVLNCLKIPIKVNLSVIFCATCCGECCCGGSGVATGGRGGEVGGVSEAYKTVGRNDNYASFPSPLPALGLFVMHS